MKKIKTISSLIVLVSVLSVSAIIYSCSCSSCGQDEVQIPYEVLQSSNNFIASQTGEEFFSKYISFDYYRSKKLDKKYFMSYKIFIPEKPFVDSEIRFTVDSLGRVLADTEIYGIPKCAERSSECMFNVDEESARQIALDEGLEQGVKEWKLGFLWDAKYDMYVWHVLSTLSESEGEFGYRASGKEIIIDPNDGSIISRNDWKIN